jgi:hypothetical protein
MVAFFFISLFICGLFNRVVCSSDYIASNERIWTLSFASFPIHYSLLILTAPLNKPQMLGWCGFCLRRLSPNNNCMLAIYNTQFYSFRIPVSNLFGIFRFELMIRNFQECQVEKHEHFRHLLPYKFDPGSIAAEAARNIFAVYREDCIAKRRDQKWFVRFRQGNFDTCDTLLSGRNLVGYGGDYPLRTA